MARNSEFLNSLKFGKKKNISLVKVFRAQIVMVVSLMFVVVLYLWIKREYKTLSVETEKIQHEYINAQKENIKQETERAVNFINYKIHQTDLDIRQKLKKRVEMAYNIAQNIYDKNKDDLTLNEIKSLITEALRPIRYDGGRGYFFIGSLNGYEILFPDHPEYEEKNLYDLKDDLGNYVVRNEINLAKLQGEGFIINYWTRPGSSSGMASKKLSYIKLFEPLNWYFGTGDYYEDFTSEVQNQTLRWLSNYRFGNEGYIFVNTYDGHALLMDGEVVEGEKFIWNLEDPNGTKVIQKEREAIKNPEGDFIYYSWRKLTSPDTSQKISFVKGIPEWQWMVGAGIYLEEMNEVLAAKKEKLQSEIKRDVLWVVIWLTIILVFIYGLTYLLSYRAKKTIESFVRFFKKASHENILIDESDISFSEFKVLGNSVNKMITEIKESKIRNLEKEARYEKLFEESPEAIAFLNKDNSILRVNAAFTKLFGFENYEIMHHRLNELIVPEELRKEALLYSNNFKKGLKKQIEAIRLTKNNEKVHVSVIGTPITFNNTLFGYYVIYRNISEQKAFEQQLYDSKIKAEESDRLKTSFLTNLSHEIRTPLNAIIGFSTLLNTKEVSREDQKEYLRLLSNSGKLLLEIIDNIIDISKIESANLSINKTNSNINTMFDELLIDFTEFKNNMNLDKLDLTLKKEITDTEFYVLTDVKRLKQIFTNLIDNALKFTAKGTVEFGYTIKGGNILCYVKDTGIGIDQTELHFIFDRFRQADESTTRRYGGTGIGLAICKSLVELLGGNIWVESKKHEGSSFFFTIPNESTEKQKNPLVTRTTTKNINWQNKKILIAEDVEANYKLLYTYLANTGATIEWARDGNQAVNMIEDNPDFDLILMDINMPVMNGHEAVEMIREKGHEIPVIAQTAYATDENQEEMFSIGYQDYILKPIGLKQLIQKMSKYLD